MGKIINLSARARKSLEIGLDVEITEEEFEKLCDDIYNSNDRVEINVEDEDLSFFSEYITNNSFFSEFNGPKIKFIDQYSKVHYTDADAINYLKFNILYPGIAFSQLKYVLEKKDDSIDMEYIPLMSRVPVSLKDIVEGFHAELQQMEEILNDEIKLEIRVDDINDVNEVNIEELRKVQQMHDEDIPVYFMDSTSQEESIEEIKLIQEKIRELTGDIKETDSDLDKFFSIYKKLGRSITYNNEQCDIIEKERRGEELTPEEQIKVRQSQNLHGLISQSTVCAGYSRALQCALTSVGIECKFIYGKTDRERDSNHAWNQVKIDGKWYNTDLTLDVKNIREGFAPIYTLRSDEDFDRHQIDSRIRDHEVCAESLDKKQICDYLALSNQERMKLLIEYGFVKQDSLERNSIRT